MASWMMNTDVIWFGTSSIKRLTSNKYSTSHPEIATDTRITSICHLKTGAGITRRASIILRGSIAYLRFQTCDAEIENR